MHTVSMNGKQLVFINNMNRTDELLYAVWPGTWFNKSETRSALILLTLIEASFIQNGKIL